MMFSMIGKRTTSPSGPCALKSAGSVLVAPSRMMVDVYYVYVQFTHVRTTSSHPVGLDWILVPSTRSVYGVRLHTRCPLARPTHALQPAT
jgi:hypothetical protein